MSICMYVSEWMLSVIGFVLCFWFDGSACCLKWFGVFGSVVCDVSCIVRLEEQWFGLDCTCMVKW